MANPFISTACARKLALLKQGLISNEGIGKSKNIEDVVKSIGLLQLDAVNVVERSHYLVLLSRIGYYEKSSIDKLVHPGRRLIEQWMHCASLIPMEDYQQLLPIIEARVGEPLSERKQAQLGRDPEHTLREVYERIKNEGALRTRDFNPSSEKLRAWWNKKPASIALGRLSYTGAISSTHRINFESYFDLTERVVPADFRASTGTLPEAYRWTVMRSLACMGIATAQQIADYYRQPLKKIRPAIAELMAEKAIFEVTVENWRHCAYLRKEDFKRINQSGLTGPESKTALLSPFDNLIWHRDRTRELFDFEFRNEMYTPIQQRDRVHGYYVMPILHAGALVGRVDVKVERKSRTLLLRKLSFENGQPPKEIIPALIPFFQEFMKFLKCQTLSLDESFGARIKSMLMKHLSNH
jgi:uncharacterized protein YcaQ